MKIEVLSCVAAVVAEVMFLTLMVLFAHQLAGFGEEVVGFMWVVAGGLPGIAVYQLTKRAMSRKTMEQTTAPA